MLVRFSRISQQYRNLQFYVTNPENGCYTFSLNGDRIIMCWNQMGMGTRGFFHGVKQLEHEAGNSHLSNAEVEKGGAVPPLPHVFMVSA